MNHDLKWTQALGNRHILYNQNTREHDLLCKITQDYGSTKSTPDHEISMVILIFTSRDHESVKKWAAHDTASNYKY